MNLTRFSYWKSDSDPAMLNADQQLFYMILFCFHVKHMRGEGDYSTDLELLVILMILLPIQIGIYAHVDKISMFMSQHVEGGF